MARYRKADLLTVPPSGMLVSFAVGQVLSWRGLAMLGATLSLLPVVVLLLLPETPQHLTRTGTCAFGQPPLNIFMYHCLILVRPPRAPF